MKKKGIVLGVLLAFCMLLVPSVVKAASGTIFGAAESSMRTTTMDGEVTLTYTKDGSRPVIYLGVNLSDVSNGAFKAYNAEIELQNSNFTFSGSDADVRLQSGWSGTVRNGSNGKIIVSLTHADGITQTGRNTLVARITLDVTDKSNDDECVMTLRQTSASESENPKCRVEDNKYYCQDGSECTKNEYEEQCPSTTENPQTGSFIPYAVIIAGIGVAGGLYFLTKRNKIYHI